MISIKALTTSLIILVHSWYPTQCCNDAMQDCRPVPCDEIADIGGGAYKYHNTIFSKNQVHPSQDSQCHVCIGGPTKTEFPYCVFIQQST